MDLVGAFAAAYDENNGIHHKRSESETDQPCDVGKSMLDRARATLTALFDDLFGDDEEKKFNHADASVVSGGMLFWRAVVALPAR